MATPVRPSKLARILGFEPADFCEACRNGAQEYNGYPIGDWLVRDGKNVYLNVPDELIDGRADGRSSGTPPQQRGNPSSGLEGMPEATSDTTKMAEAVDNNAAPVSANVSAAFAADAMSDAVRENPELFETLTDLVALLGGGGLGIAATEEGEDNRVWKVGGTALGSFAAWKILRYVCEQGDRRTDMAEREQRHRIQEEKQTQKMPAHRGDGAELGTRAVSVRGTGERRPRR